MVCIQELPTRSQPFRPGVWPVNPSYVNARLDFSTPLRSARNDKKKDRSARNDKKKDRSARKGKAPPLPGLSQ
jgi:hypothetical protein